MATVYVKHPVSAEDVAKYRKQFDRILDVRFMPDKLEAGDLDATKPKPRRKKAE